MRQTHSNEVMLLRLAASVRFTLQSATTVSKNHAYAPHRLVLLLSHPSNIDHWKNLGQLRKGFAAWTSTRTLVCFSMVMDGKEDGQRRLSISVSPLIIIAWECLKGHEMTSWLQKT